MSQSLTMSLLRSHSVESSSVTAANRQSKQDSSRIRQALAMLTSTLRSGCKLPALIGLLLALAVAPSSAFAQGAPPLRVILLPRLIPDAIQQMLPIVFDSPANATAITPQKITLVAMAYCGGDSAGGASAVGVAVPGQAQASQPSAISSNDCTGPLASTVARLTNSGLGYDWLEVIKLRAAWTPWRLTLSIVDAAGAAKTGFTAPNLKNIGQVKAFNTSDIRILTGPGANVGFDLAVGFPGSATTVIAFPNGHVSNPLPFLNDPTIGTEIAGAPTMSNVIADAQYTFINQVLHLYGSTFDIPIPIEGVTETMTAKNVVIAGAENAMTVSGNLVYRAISYNASVRCEGEDLAVKQVTLDTPPTDCNQEDMLTRLQCQGQGVATYGSSKALAAAITNYYQGQPLHVSTRTQPLDFAVGDTQYQATFEALKSSSHGGLFSEAGSASIRRGGGS
jgi:hypothetical protein